MRTTSRLPIVTRPSGEVSTYRVTTVFDRPIESAEVPTIRRQA